MGAVKHFGLAVSLLMEANPELTKSQAEDIVLSGGAVVSPDEIMARIVVAGGRCEILHQHFHAVTPDGDSIEFTTGPTGKPFVYSCDGSGEGWAYAWLKNIGICAPPKTAEEIAADLATADGYWRASAPYQGTLGEVYLRDVRKITIPLDCVRYHVRMRALLARRQWPDGTPRGAIVTYLKPDGQRDWRKDLGIKDGGVAIRLAPAGRKLILGEGVESVASVMQLTDLPGWACGTANDLANVILPREVREVVLAIDNDKAGLKKGYALRRRLLGERRKVTVEIPPPPHNDWNDFLRKCDHG